MSTTQYTFNLSLVPDELKWLIYEEELKLGTITCPESVYMTVLALRFILNEQVSVGYTYDRFDSHKVFWRVLDEYGYRTEIIVFRDIVEDDDGDGNWYVRQPQSWHKLATVRCSDGDGRITHVTIDTMPYGTIEYRPEAGIRRLIDDAALSLRASSGHTTGSWYINHRWADLAYEVQQDWGIYGRNVVLTVTPRDI